MKKRSNFFYDSFVEQINYAVKAMSILKEGLLNFDGIDTLTLKNMFMKLNIMLIL